MAKAKKNLSRTRETIVNDFVIIPNNNEILSISVLIGDIDQTGSSRIEIRNDPSFPAKDIDGSFDKEIMDKSKKMDGKTILVTTSVTDTNNNTNNNRTEATLKIFVGNTIKYVKNLQSDVANEGDTETFIFNIDCHAF